MTLLATNLAVFSSAGAVPSLYSATTYADNVALPAFAHRAAVRRAAIDRYLLPAGTDRQTYGPTDAYTLPCVLCGQ